jgi:succinyl-diaminopimelate desuccinylase
VAFFAEQSIPAANFGPADPLLAHTQGEFVTRDQLEAAWQTLVGLVTT